MPLSRARRAALILAAPSALSVVLAGCGASEQADAEEASGPIIIGTTDEVTQLDPAGAHDSGSLTLQTQIFPYLMNTAPGSDEVVPDLAESAEFTGPTRYTVTLPPGLTWANGHELTSSDVKFSFDRQLWLADEDGPSALLSNITWLETPDDRTVVFNLRTENDQTFPRVLTSAAGAIVDEESFSANALTPDAKIVGSRAFGGPYGIGAYTLNERVELVPNEQYSGLVDPAQNDGVTLTYYADSADLKRALQDGEVEVAHHGLSPSDVEELASDENLKVHEGPVGEAIITPDMPDVPAVEGTQVAVAATGIDGIQLDSSAKLRMSLITR